MAETSPRGPGPHWDRALIETRSSSPRHLLFPRRVRDAVALVIAAGLLLLSAAPIDPRHVGGFEVSVFHWINDLPGGLYWPVWAVMQLGNLLAVPVLAIVALFLRRVRLAVDLVLAGAGAWVAAKIVKQIVPRGRPGQLLGHVVLRHAPGAGHGFVAGHAATACALAAVAWPYLGRRARWVAAGLALIVCFGRVYVGAHLPLDVVGGAALGVAIGALIHLLLGAPSSDRGSTRADAGGSDATLPR